MNSIDVSQDKFLGGRLLISQLKRGYRAGTDPVLLAASLSLKPEQTLLDLGCGVGTAFLCALARENSIKATGIELQKELSDLAINNVKYSWHYKTVFAALLAVLISRILVVVPLSYLTSLHNFRYDTIVPLDVFYTISCMTYPSLL